MPHKQQVKIYPKVLKSMSIFCMVNVIDHNIWSGEASETIQ